MNNYTLLQYLLKTSLLLLLLLGSSLAQPLLAQCNPDTTPPDVDCSSFQVSLGIDGTSTFFWSTDISDFCDGNDITIEYNVNGGPTIIGDSVVFDCSHIGMNSIFVRATDQSGNWATCNYSFNVRNVISPVAICDANVNIYLDVNGQAIITPDMIDDGSTGTVCSNLDLKISPQGDNMLYDSIQITCDDASISQLVLTVIDLVNGNTAVCITDITVLDTSSACQGLCNPDLTPPTIDCSSYQIALGVNGNATFYWADDIIDFCDGSNITIEYEINGGPTLTGESILFDCSHIGMNSVFVRATDQAGNEASCTFDFEVRSLLGPAVACDLDVNIYLDANGQATITPDMLEEGSVGGPCSDLLLQLTLPGDTTLYDSIQITCDDSYLDFVGLNVLDLNSGFSASCFSNIIIHDTSNYCQNYTLTGTVFSDTSLNCIFDPNEDPLNSIIEIEVTNTNTGAVTLFGSDPNGQYTFSSAYDPNDPSPTLEIRLLNVPSFLQHCGTVQSITLPNGASSAQLDFPLKAFQDCPYQSVDISTNRIRPCWVNHYTVSYCNYSLIPIVDAYVIVTVDDLFVNLEGSSVPSDSIAENTYRFDLGTLAPMTCGDFFLDLRSSCDVIPGQTLCVEANIYPAANCTPPNANWSGAQIVAESSCEGDSVLFQLQNIGTGDMTEIQQYLIVEDLVMYMSNPFQLGVNEQLNIRVPANGNTWRMEADQEPGYPGAAQPIAWSEGCGGLNNTGLVNIFPVNNTDVTQSIFCLEAINSYDPNDKQGFPLGIEEDHFISANQSIDYLIRFQNTGTDTAYRVEIVDTLSTLLNFATLQPGASSHPYRFEASKDGVVRFIFDDILLPDSTTNEPASNGFVRFKVAQKVDLDEGSLIENRAGIYFDFNDPIITNTTWHTIEYAPITTSTTPNINSLERVQVSPNPFGDHVQIQITGEALTNAQLSVYDLMGRLVAQRIFSGNQVSLLRDSLPAGVYWYEINEAQQKIGTGKIIAE